MCYRSSKITFRAPIFLFVAAMLAASGSFAATLENQYLKVTGSKCSRLPRKRISGFRKWISRRSVFRRRSLAMRSGCARFAAGSRLDVTACGQPRA